MRRSPHGLRRGPLSTAAVVLVIALGLGACGDDGDAVDMSLCKVISITDGVSRVTVTGENMAFDETCYRLRPGPAEFTFVNADSGVSHNLRVSGPGDVDEATELERGEVTQVLEVDLSTPGTYDFKCDPHPNTMRGKIVVEEPDAA